MRRIYSASENARAMDEIAFQASLHALLTAVGQLENGAEPPIVDGMSQPAVRRVES
jgi:hypothetical protein